MSLFHAVMVCAVLLEKRGKVEVGIFSYSIPIIHYAKSINILAYFMNKILLFYFDYSEQKLNDS